MGFCDYVFAYFLVFLVVGSIGGFLTADFVTRNIESRFLTALASIPILLIFWAIELNVLLHFLDTRCT